MSTTTLGRTDRPATREYVDLLTTLAARALKVRYRGSILGVFWSLSNPLLMTGIYTLIFGAAFAKYYDNSILNYVLAVFVGLTVLAFFSSSTTQALSSIVSNGVLLNKISLPYSVFPVSTVLANVFQLSVGTLPLLMIVTLVRTHSFLNVIALFAPVFGLILVCLGFGLALASFFVYFRDMPYLYELFTFVIYMTTPIFYPAAFVPASVRIYLQYNPLATIVEGVRRIALFPGLPEFATIFAPLAVGGLIFLLGAAIFVAMRKDFIDLL
jgi:ABC-type polysaccharide/polyol phosphate export permease